MKNFIHHLVVFILVFIVQMAYSQTRQISGTVVNENNEPVIGATVKALDSDIGTITDLDGSFSLGVPDDATQLQVSYVTMDTPIIVPITSDQIMINIGDQTINLDDLVVTGYSEQARRNFTGAATSVSEKTYEQKNTSDFTKALAGEISGVQVISTSGRPGTNATIRIRGYSSVNGNRAPLFVVDGAPYEGDLSAINPADIASTTVLKDATATALYGARGASGVIVITTKKGTAGGGIFADFKQGFNYRTFPVYSRIESPEEYVEIGWEGLENYYDAETASERIYGRYGLNDYYNIWNAEPTELIDPNTGKFYPGIQRKYTPEKRRDYFFDTSNRSEANIQLSGGSDKTSLMTSFGYLNDKGYYIGSNFKRFTGRLRATYQVLPWLKGDVNFGYGRTEGNFPGSTGFDVERNAAPVYGIYEHNPDGSFVRDTILGGNKFDYGEGRRAFNQLNNIAGDVRYNIFDGYRRNLNGGAQLGATFLQNFDFTARFSYQNLNSVTNNLKNPYYGPASTGELKGSLDKDSGTSETISFLQMLRYGREIGPHSFSITGAHESNQTQTGLITQEGVGLYLPRSTEIANTIQKNPGNSYTDEFTLESYFAMGDYDFEGKYLVNASIRRDGSSRFAKSHRWGTFPAIGFGWIVSNEDFLKADYIDFLKLRASIGATGDQRGVFLYNGGGNSFDFATLSGIIPAFTRRDVVDPDLTWEKVIKRDIGLEFSAFDRFSATLDYYNNKTKDLIFLRLVGPSAGFNGLDVNDGELLNSGFEFDLAGDIIKKNDFNLRLSFNGATLKNKLSKAPKDPSTGEAININDKGLYGYRKGHSIFDYYIPNFEGVDPETGLSQWTVYYNDANNDGIYDKGEEVTNLEEYKADNPNATLKKDVTSTYSQATQYFTGQNALPKLRGATRLSIGYKGFSMTGQLLYSFGGHSYDSNYARLMGNDKVGENAWHTDIRKRWQKEGDITDVPKITNGYGTVNRNQNATSTRFLTKKDYFLLNNVQLNYDLPSNWIQKVGIKQASIWVSGDNLWSKTKRDGFFPFNSETGGPDLYAYDPLTTTNFGIKFKF